MLSGFTGLSRIFRKENKEDEASLMSALDKTRLPCHIAIIMDGNGRWAKKRGLPRAVGHRAGVESLRDVVRLCAELEIGILTLYSFSTENWKRPREEINILMDLLVEYLHKEIDELCNNNIRINAIGAIEELPGKARQALDIARKKSKGNTGLTLNLALNYGARMEIVQAVRAICVKVAKGGMEPEEVDQDTIAGHLYTVGQPEPDLLVRPSGDYRISNFLLWQLAYTEFWFTDVMWPDFRRIHLLKAISDFQKRDRRFGGLNS